MNFYANFKILFSIIVLFLLNNLFYDLTAQKKTDELRSYSIKISSTENIVFLPHQFIIFGSELIYADSVNIFKRDIDYKINYITGKIQFIGIDKEIVIKIFYQILPLDLKSEYFNSVKILDTNRANEKILIPKKSFSLSSPQDLFGDKINKSGSLIRGFSMGSNKDLTLNSGFRLQMNGNLSDDISLTAALTDEKTPILPEGNTQTLRDIDKVFIDVNHKNFNITLGDFVFENKSESFGNISRKLQGGKIDIFNEKLFAGLSYAAPSGKYTTNEFLGFDGVQGPYRLKAADQSPGIIIIPGSEKVYLDGRLLKRGDQEDYIIDYSLAEIIFTVKNVIRNNSRIIIDFEYNNRKYDRTFISARSGGSLFNDLFKSSITFIQEGDDNSSAIDMNLDDETKKLIEIAGNDKLKAAKSGIDSVGINPATGLGRGQYSRLDTLIDSKLYSYYIYLPGTKTAIYSITFSYIGENEGDYIRESIGNYRWVGYKKGQYLPISLFALPERNRAFIWNVSAQPVKKLNLSGELALSNYDRNTLSNLNDNDNNGFAYNFKIDYKDSIDIFENNSGPFGLKITNNYISEKYTPIDRVTEIEYYRNWNVNDSSAIKKNILTLESFYNPMKNMEINYGWGINKYGISNESSRNNLNIFLSDSSLPKLRFEFKNIINDALTLNSKFNYLKTSLGHNLGIFELYINYSREKKQDQDKTNNKLFNGYRYDIFNSQIKLLNISLLKMLYEFEIREDQSVVEDAFFNESSRNIHRLILEISNRSNFKSNISFDLQNISYSEKFISLGSTSQKNLIVKSYLQYNALKSGIDCNLFYETSGQNSALNQRVYIRVEKGQGNYKYLGDLNNNGVADEPEFEQVRYDGDYLPVLTRSDRYEPVTDLKTSLRLKISPRKFILRPDNILEVIASNISAESYIQVNETNKDQTSSNIYLLKFDKFQNENLTIKGNSNFTQDLFLFENLNLLSVRLRYLDRNSFNQYTFGYEKKHNIERSSRIRFRFLDEFSNQTDVSSTNEISTSPAVADRNFNIKGIDIISNFSYRPEQNLEIGFQIGTGKKEDRLQNVTAFKNTQSFRTNYAMLKKGNLQIEFERTEITLQKTLQYSYYNLTEGLKIGKNWFLRINFEYQISSFIQSNLNYFGRMEGNSDVMHNAAMEIKLFF